MKVEELPARLATRCTVAVTLLLTTACAVGTLPGQSANSAGMISIRLEQKVGELTKPVPQNTVFRNGNVLRFSDQESRFRLSVRGGQGHDWRNQYAFSWCERHSW
jgi:hypothetical protein